MEIKSIDRTLLALSKFHEVRKIFKERYFMGLNYRHSETSIHGRPPESFFAKVIEYKKQGFLGNPTKKEEENVFMIRVSGESLEKFEIVFSRKINISDQRKIIIMFEEIGFIAQKPQLKLVK